MDNKDEIVYSTSTKQGTKISRGKEKSIDTARDKVRKSLDMASMWKPAPSFDKFNGYKRGQF